MIPSGDDPTDAAQRWVDGLGGRRILVAGIGLSGVAAARALLDRDAQVVVVDGRDGVAERAVAVELTARGAQVRLGDAQTAVEAGLVVTSPGWRPDQPLLAAARAADIEVIGEVELAWRLAPGRPPWVGVTGTNGKTTTVGMLASILRAAGYRTVAAGNVGLPLVEAVLADPPYDVLAVELSSFQLHGTVWARCHAGGLLNLAADHLDWHGSMAAYAADKVRIWRDDPDGVYNADDALVARLAHQQLAPGHPFTLGPPPAGGFGVLDGDLVDRLAAGSPDDAPVRYGSDGRVLARTADVALRGPHNLANALAAAAIARVAGLRPPLRVPGPAVAEGLRAYRPGPHRNALVATVDGVAFVDDSKATNPHAAAASLRAYDSVVWVCGGLLKGADPSPLVAAAATRLAGAVVIGLERAPFRDAFARHAPGIPVIEVAATDTGAMEIAVRAAAGLARAGDTVLLAPAAASMDLFRDYAARGDAFAAAVARLAGRE